MTVQYWLAAYCHHRIPHSSRLTGEAQGRSTELSGGQRCWLGVLGLEVRGSESGNSEGNVLNNWIVFYTLSAIFQSFNRGRRKCSMGVRN